MKNIDELFLEDEVRTKLALNRQLKKLKDTYLGGSYLMKDPNNPRFWNIKLKDSYKLDPMTKARVNYAVTLIPENTQSILDIGVGQGYFLSALSKKVPSTNIFGIDISLEGLRNVRNMVAGRYWAGSILSIPSKYRYDVVSAFEVLEHLPATKLFVALAEIKKRIKRNGVFLASVPINEKYSEDYNPNGHLRRYSTNLFLSELQLGGFEILNFKEFYAFSNFYFFKNLLRQIFTNRWKPNLVVVKAVIK